MSADSTPVRADYRDLNELLQPLPSVTPPVLDETRALWLATLPLACLDRPQPRPTARGNTGAGYFWVATYSLAADHDRLRAIWGAMIGTLPWRRRGRRCDCSKHFRTARFVSFFSRHSIPPTFIR